MKVKKRSYTLEFSSRSKQGISPDFKGRLSFFQEGRAEQALRSLVHEGYKVTITEDEVEVEQEEPKINKGFMNNMWVPNAGSSLRAMIDNAHEAQVKANLGHPVEDPTGL